MTRMKELRTPRSQFAHPNFSPYPVDDGCDRDGASFIDPTQIFTFDLGDADNLPVGQRARPLALLFAAGKKFGKAMNGRVRETGQ